MYIIDMKHMKARLLCELRTYLRKVRRTLEDIDPRLWLYVEERTSPLKHFVLPMDEDGTEVPDSVASFMELLGIRKCLRLLNTYPFNVQKARLWLNAQEGAWFQEDGGRWRHVRGGLMFDTPRGAQHVRLMNFQAWTTCMAMGFEHEVCMDRKDDGSALLPSEYVGSDGMVYDVRRLCNEIHFFITRKAGKTEYGVSLDFAEFLVMGDMNAQVTIVGNSKDSAVGIAYDKARHYAWQIDPSSTNKLGGKLLKVGSSGMEYVAGCKRTASLAAFAAGGKPKDGWNSEWVHADEHGQARYVNEHSDMEGTVQVFVGSGGVRRERMLLHTTTAGLIDTGPYKELLEKVQRLLMEEMDIPLGTACKTDEDRWFALICQLDAWDYDGTLESLSEPHLCRRVNPAFGITVQPTWYRERLHEAATKNEDVRKEVLTKDFNLWQSDRVKRWITQDEIRSLMVSESIRQCSRKEWVAFCAMDFSKGDDLCAIGWVAINTKTKQVLWDCDAWIAEEQLGKSPNRVLYKQWIDAGWLHVCPGEILDGAAVIEVIEEVSQHVRIMAFGYDAYDSNRFVNHIKAWMVAKLQRKGASLKAIEAELKKRLQSVSQTYATYNSACQVVWDEVHWSPRKLYVHENPIISWCFGNAVLEEDPMENVKPVKNPGAPNAKVDVCQCICSCYIMIGNWGK